MRFIVLHTICCLPAEIATNSLTFNSNFLFKQCERRGRRQCKHCRFSSNDLFREDRPSRTGFARMSLCAGETLTTKRNNATAIDAAVRMLRRCPPPEIPARDQRDWRGSNRLPANSPRCHRYTIATSSYRSIGTTWEHSAHRVLHFAAMVKQFRNARSRSSSAKLFFHDVLLGVDLLQPISHVDCYVELNAVLQEHEISDGYATRSS